MRGGVRESYTGSPEDHGFTRPMWTLEVLRAVVEQALGVALSLACLWALSRQIGARWGWPRLIVACPRVAARRQVQFIA